MRQDTARRGLSVARLAEMLEAAARWWLVAMLTCIVLAMFAQVLDRYVFKTQFDAYEQIARLALVWATFVGVALGVRTRTNLRIDLINLVLPPWLVRAKDTLFDFVLLGIAVLINVKSWLLMEVLGSQQILGTPFTYAVSAAAITAGTAVLAAFLVLRLAGRAGRVTPDEMPEIAAGMDTIAVNDRRIVGR